MRMLPRTRGAKRGLAAAAILAVLLPAAGAHTGAAQRAPAATETLNAWQTTLSKATHPSAGCFTADYPASAWRETGCVPASSVPMLPAPGPAPLSVGGGRHYVAESPTGAPITVASGRFDSVIGVEKVLSPITATGEPVLNAYSLQLNTNHFKTSLCTTSSNSDCMGWQQFIFRNDGSKGRVFIQYWLLSYGTGADPCPVGWTKQDSPFVEVNCYVETSGKEVLGNPPISAMATFLLEGDVSHGTNDKVTFWLGSTPHSYSVTRLLDARAEWTMAEFNVFGFGYGHVARFNYDVVPDPEPDPVASVLVRTNINYGGVLRPKCQIKGFTAESNDLNYVGTKPSFGTDGPALRFWQSGHPGVRPDCNFAETIGDTHQITFAGLMYDFQAAGDFVEAQVGSDFEVQTRKVSGYPTWPNASVNQSAAARMGNTTVAVCEGTRLILDGRPVTMPPGGSATLPSGVRIQRIGDVYDVSDTNSGHAMRVELKGNHIDLQIGLGSWPVIVRGLQGSPHPDSPNLIQTRDGVTFSMPTTFENLYHRFGNSWRVPAAATLLGPCDTVQPRDPSRFYFARDLPEQDRLRGESICRQAGVTLAWMNACTLDVAWLGPTAAAVFVGRQPPVYDATPPPCPQPRPGPC